ncbi:aspartyl protease family protein At5g10770-like [Rhodamnia argentea]|uniref:Aspartyl protease family protein At5g10770-like n=1 Tax=Rhodamnia argentea TaxID=178133 RepID=A0ABM3HCC2_9MYRT|nr:aspartyl protease family protein At5g10770-like [Rhodamnia argentea]
MASLSLSFLVEILRYASLLCLLCLDDMACVVHGAQEITLPVTSLFPSPICKASTSNANSTLKLVHKNSPCSPLFNGEPVNHTQLLLEDIARVKWIRSKISGASAANSLKDSAVSITAKYGAGGTSYLVTIGLGTPKKDLTLLFDTGSALTWTQCEPCAVSCYSQAEPIFDPSQSSSYANISCSAPSCTQLPSGTARPSRCSGSTCVYATGYGDQESFTIGFFATETLTLSSTDAITGFEFGCGQNNGGRFKGFAGLFGLARDRISFVEQSATKYGRYFSYCLPPSTSSTGYLTFGMGSMTSASASFTPISMVSQSSLFYGIDITGISVGGKPLSIPSTVFSNVGSVIDSGTTVTQLPPTAYSALRSAFRQAMSNYKMSAPASGFDTCYDLSGSTMVTVPVITFSFRGPIDVQLDTSGVLVPVTQSQMCLAFSSTGDETAPSIYGNIQQRSFEVVYDVPGGRIGFRPKGCS